MRSKSAKRWDGGHRRGSAHGSQTCAGPTATDAGPIGGADSALHVRDAVRNAGVARARRRAPAKASPPPTQPSPRNSGRSPARSPSTRTRPATPAPPRSYASPPACSASRERGAACNRADAGSMRDALCSDHLSWLWSWSGRAAGLWEAVLLPAGDLFADLGTLLVGQAEVDPGPNARVDDLLDRLREARVGPRARAAFVAPNATSSVPKNSRSVAADAPPRADRPDG